MAKSITGVEFFQILRLNISANLEENLLGAVKTLRGCDYVREAGCWDLDKLSQAQVDAARLLRDLHVADGDVRHDGQRQGLERLVEAVGEALGPRHLHRQKPVNTKPES